MLSVAILQPLPIVSFLTRQQRGNARSKSRTHDRPLRTGDIVSFEGTQWRIMEFVEIDGNPAADLSALPPKTWDPTTNDSWDSWTPARTIRTLPELSRTTQEILSEKTG